MHKLQYKIIQTTSSGSHHVQVLIDDSDAGILYVNDNEYQMLDIMAKHAHLNDICNYEKDYLDDGV